MFFNLLLEDFNRFTGIKDTDFLVTMLAKQNIAAHDIIHWNNINRDNGGNYNRATGSYIVDLPFDGYYEFRAAVRVKGDYAAFIFWVDSQSERYCWSSRSSLYDGVQTTCTITISLKAGQLVQIKTAFAGEYSGQLTVQEYVPGLVVIFCFPSKLLRNVPLATDDNDHGFSKVK